MKAARVSLVVIAAALGAATPLLAQTEMAWRLETGLGGEFLNSSSNRDPLPRLYASGGGELSFAPRSSSFTYLFGVQAERHSILGGGSACPVEQVLRPIGYVGESCYTPLPTFVGARLTLGARYALRPDVSVGLRVGLGYLSNTSTAYDNGDTRIRSLQIEMARELSDHVTIAGRAEQMEMPNYEGVYARARPVSVVLRVR